MARASVPDDEILQSLVEEAMQGFRSDGSIAKLHDEFNELLKEADKMKSDTNELCQIYEACKNSVEQLHENITKYETTSIPELVDHDYTFTSARNDTNPWSIQELYKELEGTNLTIPDLIRRKQQRMNGETSCERCAPIEMLDEDKELFTHLVCPKAPWTIFDLYEDMQPHENTVDVLARKKRELQKKKSTDASTNNSKTTSPSITPLTPGVKKDEGTSKESIPEEDDDEVQLIRVKEKEKREKSKADSNGIITSFPQPERGEKILARWKENIWYVGTLIDIIKDPKGQEKFKVRLETGTEDYVTIMVSGKQIACYHSAKPTEITIGQRVAALFREEDGDDCLYAGIVAELPMTINDGRYLVFFDDGYVQYMSRKRIHLVYQNSKEVWKDVEEMMADFVKDYLDQYPFRPLVKAFQFNEIKTEFQGRWLKATVLDVDYSLVLMQYKDDKQKEWLYRGSTRLEPVYRFVMMHKYGEGVTEARVHQNMKKVIYSIIQAHHYLPVSTSKKKKQMARKSSGGSSRLRKVEAHIHDEVEIINLDPDEPKVETVEEEKEPTKNQRKIKFEMHACGPTCAKHCWPVPNVNMKTINPLRRPEVCGWRREIVKQRSGSCKRQIMYKTPCGRSLRSLEEIDRYLTETEIFYLAVDHFDFNPYVITLPRALRLSKPAQLELNDISLGSEPIPISCINYVDDSPPLSFRYVVHRSELDGKKINMDDDFLVGCDCTDNCQDKSKCACQQLTIDATAILPPFERKLDAGYTFRRLEAPFRTGVWECNQRCKCRKQCHNRVVQNGLQHRLQIFKTERKGWGIRCLDDIPRGSFVCIYVGHIWNDEEANKRGAEGRDNYFAELDYLEVVEKTKEDYESDVDSDMISSDLSEEDSPSPIRRKNSPSADEGSDSGGGGDASSDEDFIPTSRRQEHPMKSSAGTSSSSGKSVAFAKEKEKAAAQFGMDFEQKLPDADSPGRGILYGYNTNPAKVLNADQLEVLHQQQLARKQRRSKSHQALQNLQTDRKGLDDPSSESDTNSLPSFDEARLPASLSLQSSSVGSSFSKLLQNAIQECKMQHNSAPSKRRHLPKEKKQEEKKSKNGDSQDSKAKEKSSGESKRRPPPTRSLFGEEQCYIMDALEAGNLGRFLNHSCSPNLYVQNVFVDTHDLRFPWVSFFAARYIRAGTELTWDYGYEIGSVPGKELLCHCGSRACKGRLL